MAEKKGLRDAKGRYKKGHSGSKPVGAKNKIFARTRDEVWAYIHEKTLQGHEANPFHVLIDTMIKTHEDNIKIGCAKVLADKLLPNLKSVEAGLDHETRRAIRFIYGTDRRR